MLNTIYKNEITGELSKVSGIPNNWVKSDFNYKKSALDSMKKLLETIDAKYILLSYNDEGIISKDELIELLTSLQYTYELKQIEYNTYRGSRNLKARNNKVYEYLWVIQKYNIV
tara:strand:- start:377 stop:718 length:342 start_codon:yes stop_codon:yes gene_type:complete